MTPVKLILSLLVLAVFVFGAAAYCQAREAATRKKKASFYGEGYRGKPMANGHPYDPDQYTCASWDWPLGTRLLVEYGGHGVVVTVTDRGPDKRLGRDIDLSEAAFAGLADRKLGVISVEISLWREASAT